MSTFIPSYLIQSEQLIKDYVQEHYPQPFHLHLKVYFKEKRRGSRDRRFLRDFSFGLIKLSFLQDQNWERFQDHLEDEKVKLQVSNYLNESDNRVDLPIIETGLRTVFERNKSDKVNLSTANYLKLDSVWIHAVDMGFNDFKNWLTKNQIVPITALEQYQCLRIQKKDLEKIKDYPNKWGIQDLSSIKAVADLDFKTGSKVWETCCGLGSKTRLLSTKPALELWVSDVRNKALLHALKRCKKGIEGSGVIDLSKPNDVLNFSSRKQSRMINQPTFDYIVADVPCSGSGTWRKNPEHLIAFKTSEIDRYQQLQRDIVLYSLPFLKPGGRLIYLTCSLFKKENEDQIPYFKSLGLNVKEKSYLHQHENDTDILYRLILEKDA